MVGVNFGHYKNEVLKLNNDPNATIFRFYNTSAGNVSHESRFADREATTAILLMV
jgi:hypothetical protein